ncbi:predicted protein [Verticillium alfalfae VaMs.102]|uniref:Predicted protein n=1 Tax=Verticillium alfalfae (strain VaMs.102 / ATCC MYA-4576 / FGSC 10136) TaxID=526221 RepID=C9S6I3_VERA1|nr:predicted protein [Verticillium alfalfae VaMs.102]EEY14474.1 predicted protein [Verticillium alfalfae VaMs.102]
MARPAAVRWQGEAVYTCEETEKEPRVLGNPAGRSASKAGRRPEERELGVKRLESTKLTESVSDGDARRKTRITTTSTGVAPPRWRTAKRGELCEKPTISFGRMDLLGIKLKRSAPPLSRPELRDHDTSCQVVACLQNNFAAASTHGKGPHLLHLSRTM